MWRCNPFPVSTRSILSVLYLIIFGAIIGFTAYIWLMRTTTPSRVATYAYVNPVIAIFLGWEFAEELLTAQMFVAAAVIIFGVILIIVSQSPSVPAAIALDIPKRKNDVAVLHTMKGSTMTDNEIEKLKYPIGRFVKPVPLTSQVLSTCIANIEAFPQRLGAEVTWLTDEQLDTEYRLGGWTIRQVVHHVADSHMNSYTRFKLALTEEKPTIKPYFEDRWAELIGARTLSVEVSLKLLIGLHARWTVFLKSLSEQQLKRTLVHPARGQEFQLDEYIAEYSWHCNHHMEHVTNLRIKKGW